MSNINLQDEKLINRLYEIHKGIASKFESCTGIGQTRLELLHELFNVEEVSQRHLQKKVNVDHAAITRHLKYLEEKGMVVRRKNPDDQRFTFVRLSEEGRKRILDYRKEKERFISDVLESFSEEEKELLSKMLSRIQNNIAKI